MSKIQNNPVLKGASGMLGDVVVFREIRGTLIMANRPKKPKGPQTEQQKQFRMRFLRAVQYAKKQVANPVMKAEYATGVTLKKFAPYVVAVTDYLTPPEIHEVTTSGYTGVVGDAILVRATDDFKVVGVHVSVVAPQGNLIEFGEAILQPDTYDDWRYSITVENGPVPPGTTIVVTARDLAGNVTTAEAVM